MRHHIQTAAEIERRQAEAEKANARRRELTRAVRDTREKITSLSGLRRVFEIELAQLFAKSHLNALIIVLAFTTVIAAATLTWAAPGRALVWLVITSLAVVGQSLVCRAFLKLENPAEGLQASMMRLMLSEVVIVFCWSLLPLVVGLPESEGLRLFLLFSILLFAALSAVLSHPLPAAVYGTLLPIGVTIVHLVMDRLPTERLMIAGLSFGAMLLFMILANRLYQFTLDGLQARAEKDELIHEIEQTNIRLKEATKHAEDANAAKSKFLATMSHELRTPLNAILGFSEVIRGEMFGPVGNEQYKSYVNDIHESGTHLLELINEVLDLSRIEAGKHELQEEAIDLVSTIDACVHMLDLRAKGRGLIVRTAYTETMPRLWADERAIRQVALNLLSNAIKFTPQGAEIVVKAGWTASGGQYFSVKDNGMGIPEDEIETVLSTFGRGSQALKNADPGSGLGLPIVKSLVELHGGAFRLTSKVREGTEVTAIFPATRVMTAMAAVDPDSSKPTSASIRRQPPGSIRAA
ncbi:MAG: ATP-binding protein [Beijerinckiaceae bacterium]|jgi:two-component system cell cycle sensor histidine kinase PleC|nr:ATP-binding protein [Beijerinckiaceae bacterium]